MDSMEVRAVWADFRGYWYRHFQKKGNSHVKCLVSELFDDGGPGSVCDDLERQRCGHAQVARGKRRVGKLDSRAIG
jgi:hypothetical protein